MSISATPSANETTHPNPLFLATIDGERFASPQDYAKQRWRKQQADQCLTRYRQRIAELEASIDLDAFGPHGARLVRFSVASHVQSWSYFTFETTWAVFCALASETREKTSLTGGNRGKKDSDALTLASLFGGTDAEGARAISQHVQGFNILGLDFDLGHFKKDEIEAKCRELGLECVVTESYSSGTTRTELVWATFDEQDEPMMSEFAEYAQREFGVTDHEKVTAEQCEAYLVDIEGYDAERLGKVTIAGVFNSAVDPEADPVELSLAIDHAPIPKTRLFVLLNERVEIAKGERVEKFKERYKRDIYNPIAAKFGHCDPTCSSIERRWYWRTHRPLYQPAPAVHVSGKPLEFVTQGRASEPRKEVPRGETGGAPRTDWRGFLAATAAADLIDRADDKRSNKEHPLVAVNCPFRSSHGKSKAGVNQLMVHDAETPNRLPVVKCHSATCKGHEHHWEEYLSALFAGYDVSDPKYWLRDASIYDAQQTGEDEEEGESFSGFVETGNQPEFQNYKSYPYPFAALCDHVLARLVEQNAAAPRIFVMDGALVRIQRNTLTGQTYAEKLSTNGLRHEIDRAMHFCNVFFEGSTRKKQGYPCPKDIVEHIMASPSFSGMPELISITDTPFFDKDCNLIETRGYHAPSKTFYQPPSGFRMPPVPHDPTVRDVARARRILAEPLYNIPFDDGDTAEDGQASRTNWTAKLIQAFVHEPISGACPLYAVMKPKERTGATLTAQIHSIIAYGTRAQLQNEKKDEEELQKTIVSLLKAGTRSIVLDNLHKKLDSATVATVATGTIYQGRQLGTNEMIIAPIRCEFEFNGNNLRTTNEIRERAVLIRIDAKSPNPGDRDTKAFRYPLLLDSVEKARPLYVWAVLTLIQAWVAAARPKWSGKPMGGFEKHNGIVGGILDNAGYVDKDGKSLFLANRSLLRESVGDDSAVPTAFVQLWWNRFQGGDCKVGMLEKDTEPADYTDEASEYRRKKVETLVDLFTANAGNLDLGFNGWQKPAWANGLRGQLDKMQEQHFVILDGNTPIQICVKFRGKTRAWYLVRSGVGVGAGLSR